MESRLLLDLSRPGWPVLLVAGDLQDQLGSTADALLRLTWPHLWDEHERTTALRELIAAGEGGSVRLDTRRPDGRCFHSVVVVEPGAGSSRLALCRVITADPPQDPNRDGLTGVATRAVFERALGRAISRAERTGASLAVVFLDLDGLKEVNDRFGHLAGDAVLRAVADRWSATLREHDLLARFGGHEFVVLLTDVGTPPEEAAARTAEHLAGRLDRPVVHEDRDLTVSVGAGWACYGMHDAERAGQAVRREEVRDALLDRARRAVGTSERLRPRVDSNREREDRRRGG